MSYTRSTRTTRTIISDGKGPPRVETKTYSFGDDDGAHGGFSTGGGGMPSSFNIGFGGFSKKFGFGGGGDDGGSADAGGDGGSSGFRISIPSEDKADPVVGRSSRKETRNPFSGVMNQKYDDVKKQCCDGGMVFEDPEFPAVDQSIFFSRSPPKPFEWKRPSEICDDPQFVSDGASRFDVQQGELGDCWLLAAVASLTINKKLFARVCPHQDFTSDYCGMFKFNIWHQGDWIEVIVDDRLPTYNGRLVFMHSADKSEFWSALLEKAYAKLCGSYESLKGGSSSEAMEDFTGGITEMIDLGNPPKQLLKIMMKAYERGSLMGCSIDPDPHKVEAERADGLIMGHAYSVTAIKLADIKTSRSSGKIPLVRVRNPWGNEAEWKGAWSDNSPEWQCLTQEMKDDLGLSFDDDGEFWMSFQDFTANFQKLEICNLSPDATEMDEMSQQKKKWAVTKENAEWKRRVNAGGCRNYLETFWTNPQFRITLTDPDDDDDDDLCTIIIGVLQKDRRKKKMEGLDLVTMGYVIYKIPDDLAEENTGHLDMKFFKYNASCAKAPAFINLREVCGRHNLPPGTYVIIPSTFEPHQEADFIVRIFTEKAAEAGEIDEETCLQEPEPEQPSQDDLMQESQLKATFKKISGDDMEIDAYELQDILNAVFTREFKFPGFSIDACRSMVSMHDGDLSGKLGYDEFKLLWRDLRRWKGTFKEFDKDNSGQLNSYELRAALNAMGFRLSNRTLTAIVMRYSNRNGEIDFGDFIQCSIKLKTMITSYKNSDHANSGLAAFNIDNFIQTTMYS